MTNSSESFDEDDKVYYQRLAEVEKLRREAGEYEYSEYSAEDSDAGLIDEQTGAEFISAMGFLHTHVKERIDPSVQLFSEQTAAEAAARLAERAAQEAAKEAARLTLAKQNARRVRDAMAGEGGAEALSANASALNKRQVAAIAAANAAAPASAAAAAPVAASGALASIQDLIANDSDSEAFLGETTTTAPGATVAEAMLHADGASNYLAAQDLDDTDKFLIDYVLNQKWKNTESVTVPTAVADSAGLVNPAQAAPARRSTAPSLFGGDFDVDVDGEEEDIAEEFEEIYNHRFEEPGADKIATYARNAPTARDLTGKRSKRKLARERRMLMLEDERRRLEDVIRRNRAAKRKELIERLKAVATQAGNGSAVKALQRLGGGDGDLGEVLNDPFLRTIAKELDEGVLGVGKGKAKGKGKGKDRHAEAEAEAEAEVEAGSGSEWDPDAHDNMMANAFGDHYYAAGADDVANLEKVRGEEEIADPAAVEEASELDAELDAELVEAGEGLGNALRDYQTAETVENAEARVAGAETFEYIPVERETFGLTAEQILTLPAAELNRRVSIKAYAPYRETKWRTRSQPARNGQRRINDGPLPGHLKKKMEAKKKVRDAKTGGINVSRPRAAAYDA